MKPKLALGPVLFLCLLATLSISNGHALGQTAPAGYEIPESTLSPDHLYGVTVPSLDTPNPHNSLVEVKTGNVLAVIQANVGYEQSNHISLLPSRWTKDGSFLLWEVDGKWCDTALVLLKLQNGKVEWQIDLLKTGQQTILAKTKQAAPKKYRAAKEQNKDDGSAYPEGFTVDVVVVSKEDEESLSLPLALHVYLTSNPKAIEGKIDLNARLDAIVNGNGTFSVTNFHLGATPPARRW
jgi:hypothetical protein